MSWLQLDDFLAVVHMPSDLAEKLKQGFHK
jgi:hypothetical protein